MVGFLYKVTNIANGKIYIGKTYLTVEERWKRHVADSNRKDRNDNTKFHNAIRKYGECNFRVDKLGEFEAGELENKEQEYIRKYDSFNNGYNSTLGGDGNTLIEIEETEVVRLFREGKSVNKIAKEFNTGTTRKIREILNRHGYNVERQTSCYVEQYDCYGKILRTFESKRDAWKWLVENYKGDLKRATAYYRIKQSSDNGGIAFGFRWKQYETDVVFSVASAENCEYRCNGYDGNGNIVIMDAKLADVANYIVSRDRSKNYSTVRQTIIDNNGNRVYGIKWEVYKLGCNKH